VWLKLGKISPEKLLELVFPYQGKNRKEVIYNASLGRDCGVVDCDEDLIALTCDPITGTSTHIGSFAVHVVANDLICAGADPVGLLISIVLPTNSDENQIQSIMKDVDLTSKKIGIAVLGGHTEISDVVNHTLIHCFGIGRIKRNNIPDVEKVQPGDSIIITKGAGIEGTAILANLYYEQLSTQFGQSFVQKAQDFIALLSVVPEGKIALKHSPHCLHDATEGGLLGALWEVCAGQNLGFIVQELSVPLYPETKTICDFFQIDPLKLISSGTLIIFTPHPDPLLEDLQKESIPAFQIGTITDLKDKILVHANGENEIIESCPQDELWRITEKSTEVTSF
jgi:hydrogenase expression/formation protein HypE